MPLGAPARSIDTAPEAVLAGHVPRSNIEGTRPPAPYPQVVTYKGADPTNNEGSFSCKERRISPSTRQYCHRSVRLPPDRHQERKGATLPGARGGRRLRDDASADPGFLLR